MAPPAHHSKAFLRLACWLKLRVCLRVHEQIERGIRVSICGTTVLALGTYCSISSGIQGVLSMAHMILDVSFFRRGLLG